MAYLILMTFRAGLPFQINRVETCSPSGAPSHLHFTSLYWVISRNAAFEAVALGQILCAAVLSALSLFIEPPRVRWTPNIIFAILLTAVFATALAFALQTWGQKFTPATRTALIFALEPVFALATAVLAGHEPLTASAVAGGALILAGILAVELKPAAKAGISTGPER